ncbi:MAG: hypothetical protein FJZ63_06765 [Chlamydiae bacterium]|nr:hypothetical protein [Chlamydiota bacterium]
MKTTLLITAAYLLYIGLYLTIFPMERLPFMVSYLLIGVMPATIVVSTVRLFYHRKATGQWPYTPKRISAVTLTLPQQSVVQKKHFLQFETEKLFICWALGVMSPAVLLESLDSYFMLVRWTICIAASYLCVRLKTENETFFSFLFLAVALLFNPIFPVRLNQEAWVICDKLTILLFLVYFGANQLSTSSAPNNNPSAETEEKRRKTG